MSAPFVWREMEIDRAETLRVGAICFRVKPGTPVHEGDEDGWRRHWQDLRQQADALAARAAQALQGASAPYKPSEP